MKNSTIVEYKGTRPLIEAKVGDKLGTLDFSITSEMVMRNAWANDDYNPWYLEASPFGGTIVSPVFLASFDVQVFYGYYAYPPGASLFAQQDFEYYEPVFVDRPYTLSGELVDRYERKGRTFYKARISVLDTSGKEVMRMHKTVAAPVNPVGQP